MRLFVCTGYRDLVTAAVERERKAGRKTRFGELAAAAGMQPAYFSNVLKKRGDFSADQLYLILTALQVSEEEREFGLLLLEYERASVPARKAELKSRLDEIRGENLKTEKAISAEVTDATTPASSLYYLDPYHQLVHIALGIPRYARDPGHLHSVLGLPHERIITILATLAAQGYIEQTQRGWRSKRQALHLPESSPICRPHQTAVRQLSLSHLMMEKGPGDKRVSVTFSADPATRQRIEELFLRFLKACEKQVGAAEPRELYQLNFDLFAW